MSNKTYKVLKLVSYVCWGWLAYTVITNYFGLTIAQLYIYVCLLGFPFVVVWLCLLQLQVSHIRKASIEKLKALQKTFEDIQDKLRKVGKE